jgi:hypothetical protein
MGRPKTGNKHGGARPIRRTIEEWLAPRIHDNKQYRGVVHKRGRYAARAYLNGKQYHLGTRGTPREASKLFRAFILANREVLPS